MKSSKNVVSEVYALATPIAEGLGYTIWDIEYEKIGSEYHLSITIDSEKGINIEDCEAMSRAIDPVLDEADPIAEEYHLDVSSPGIERVIKTDFHLSKCLNEKVSVKLFAPIDGVKAFVGELASYDAENIKLLCPEEIEIPRKQIAKMNIYFEF